MLKSVVSYISLLILCLPLSTSGQHIVHGEVFDISNIKPIEGCNVYIVGTTLGAGTDSQGAFSFNVPTTGTYELVYSHVGYLPQIISIEVTSDSTLLDPMPLDPLTNAIDEVVVTGKVDRKWRRQYDRFLSYIMGKNFRENKVEILNPYSVEFKSTGKGMLSEARPFTLNMRNEFTGYEIRFLVKRLFLSKSNQFMVGYPGFSPLVADSEEQQKNWEKNRAKSYNGSLRHIFISLLNNSLGSDGFDAQLTEKKPVRFQGSASQILPIVMNNTINLNKENLFKYIVIEDTDNPLVKKIILKELLKIIYRLETDINGNLQKTFIEAVDNEFLVYTNGIPVNPTSLKLYGYLASEGLYEMLPFNY